MTARAKFLFDADFGRVKEAPPQITPDEHQAAVAAAELRGYERGIASAEAQARTEAERRTAAAYERIAGALADSVLGASLQALRWCPACECDCETLRHDCGTQTMLRRGANWLENDGVNFETYWFNFPPIVGDGIRIDGTPGGSSTFISVGELRVYGPPSM